MKTSHWSEAKKKALEEALEAVEARSDWFGERVEWDLAKFEMIERVVDIAFDAGEDARSTEVK